ncbi:hypothetical protein EDB81DRAFT_789691 [Dactylonectria macrodidyma]|uniref:Secreted protein n=1 Tax=Dactylonectria macrodidyma TaxID=307937 RepID=A0A9P9J6B1_9HYPO|nr:hypothetical protein EDB81DRAFT_789691 [Dactylonectria macrodidyma]
MGRGNQWSLTNLFSLLLLNLEDGRGGKRGWFLGPAEKEHQLRTKTVYHAPIREAFTGRHWRRTWRPQGVVGRVVAEDLLVFPLGYVL